MNWAWSAFLLAVVVGFGALESFALKTGRTTLSRYIWNAFVAWPPIAVLFGMFFGGLAVHFFWHWCPPGSIGFG